MTNIVLELEPEWVNVLRPLADRPLDRFVKELAALELYRRHSISSGKAAELLEMGRFEFVRHASRLGIPFFDMSAQEMAEEVAQLKAL
jgi:predicted HTH domain antitoxin